MKYVIDTEFIDTPSCSALISFAIVREDGRALYFEFDHPQHELTPWLVEHVVPGLSGVATSFKKAAQELTDFIGGESPEFWCYYGAYDWYWFCRLFGGFMSMPKGWPIKFKEFADHQNGVPDTHGADHNALNDALSVLDAMKLKGLA